MSGRIIIVSGDTAGAQMGRLADRLRALAQTPDAGWWASSQDASLDRVAESLRAPGPERWSAMPMAGPLDRLCPKCGAAAGEECSRTFAHRFHKARF